MRNEPTGAVDRLLWRRDEDGVWLHRFDREFSGDVEGTILLEKVGPGPRHTQLTTGIAWTTWQFGMTVDYGHEREWDHQSRSYAPTWRCFLSGGLGPFYFSLMVVRARRGFDPNAVTS